jgi:capsular polysaccharide transport system permease protein
MSLENGNAGRGRFLAPLDRARLVSEALSEAARRARFSSRSRRHAQGGFGAREGQVLMSLFISATFWVMVVIPSLAGVLYFGFMASDQFESEIKFTVTGAEAPALDGIGALTGIPSTNAIQDTQIVANHLHSRAAVEILEQKLNLRSIYSDPSVDWFMRFNKDKPIERLVKYWQAMTQISIQMPAGIISIKVRAFAPEASRDIGAALIDISEKLINEMNDRMNRDALSLSESELARSSQRLSQARLNLEKARNSEGVLDASRAAEGVSKLINETKSSLLQMQQEYRTQLRVVSENAPQMMALKARMNATQGQIAELESQLTQRNPGGSTSLSSSLLRFSELELERQISEKLYAGAVASLEIARMTSERKKMYLNTFISPSLAQEARYPRRVLAIFLTVLASLLAWGVTVGSAVLVRNHMA